MIFLLLSSLYSWSVSLPIETRFIFARDLNGNEKKEIFFLHPDKKISLFHLSGNEFKPSKQGVVLSKKGVVIDFGNLYSELKGEEIVVLSSQKIDILKYDGEDIVLIKSLNMEPSPLYPLNSSLRKGNFLYDIYQDGKKRILFLYPDKGIIADENGISQTISLRGEKSVSTPEDKASVFEIPKKFSLKTTYISPLIFFEDVDGDGKNDIVQYSRDSLFVFFQKNNNFSTSADISFDLSFLKGEEKLGVLPPNIFVKDINNDARADLLLGKSGKGFAFGSKSTIYLFLNNKGFFRPVPDQVLLIESYFPEVQLIDFNRDNKTDLVTNTSGFNIWSLLKLLLMKKGEETYAFHIFKQKSFTKNPIFSRKFSFSVNISKPEEAEGKVEFSYDWDQDGFYDIMYFKKNEVLIYKGNGEKGFEGEPSFSLDVETSSKYLIDDLNGDGKMDILFWKNFRKETRVWGFFQ